MATPQIVLGQPFNENERLERAASVYQNGDCQYAEQLYQQVLEVNQNSALAYLGLGNSLYCQQRFEQAITAYTKAIQLNPENAAAYRGRGDALRKKEKLDQALADYQRAIQADSNNASAYLSIGHILFYDKDQESEAIAAYQRAVELSPQWGYAWLSLAVALDSEDREAKALDAYRKATEVNPNYTEAWNRLGLFLAKKGQLEEAIEAYSSGINSNSDCASARPSAAPICADVYYNRAEARRRSRKIAEAYEDYKIAARLNPKKERNFYTAFIYFLQQETFREYLEQNSSNYLQKANSQLVLGQINESIATYQEAIRTDPNDSNAYAGLSLAFAFIGNMDEALINYEKSVNTFNLEETEDNPLALTPTIISNNPVIDWTGMAGAFLYVQGKKEKVLSIIDQATRRDSGKSMMYLSLATGFGQFEDEAGIDIKAEWKTILSRGINRYPQTQGAQIMQFILLASQEDIDKAHQYANNTFTFNNSAIQNHPELAECLQNWQTNIYNSESVTFNDLFKTFQCMPEDFLVGGNTVFNIDSLIEHFGGIDYKESNLNENFVDASIDFQVELLNEFTSSDGQSVNIENSSEIAKFFSSQAPWYAVQGLTNQAQRVLNLALNTDPENPTALITQGAIAAQTGDLNAAINTLLQGQELSEDELKIFAQNFNDLLNTRLAPQSENWVQPPLENADNSTLRSVVKIPNNDGVGAGIVINRQGGTLYILTARHVIGGTNCINANSQGCQVSDRIAVEFYSPPGQQPIQKIAELLPQSWAGNLDLVVLTVSGGVPPDIQPLPIANTQPRRNDTLKVIGHPSETRQAWSIQPHRFINNISGQFACSQYSCLQLSEPQLSPGNSGGAVLNQNNEIVGIVIEGTNNENGNFAYSANTIRQALQQWGIHP
ncbi:MAG: tetratricopeptide repeat protein [Coleofasciculus sp. B1-GNL1-01]|uniref:tetratricopeptide repeat protein n=1 Tax=Coleofasciculus sp. B1-GNL1-01 TaxID=3068484 RepID=UPI0032FFF684